MNATIDSELVKVVQEHVCKLSNEVEKMAFKNEKERNDLKICLEKFQSHLQALEKRVEKVEHEYDTLQHEQRSTSVKVDQLATKLDDLANNQEVRQQEHGSTAVKLEQEQGFIAVKVNQLTSDQEVLHQEMASTGVRMDHVERSQEAVEQRVTELESQEKCNAPKTISYGEFYISIFYLYYFVETGISCRQNKEKFYRVSANTCN
jgi:chromosome segregation ATPase